MRSLLLPLILICLAGCHGIGSTRETVYVVRIEEGKQLKAQADLVQTMLPVAKKLQVEGCAPNSKEAAFLVDACGALLEQTGAGRELPPTRQTVDAERVKMTAAKVEVRADAEKVRAEYEKGLKTLQDKLDAALAALQAARVGSAKAWLLTKLGSILVATVLAVAALSWWAPARAFAPLAGIGGATLFAAVVVRACSGDLLVVGIIAAVAIVIYLAGMWFLERRKWMRADAEATVANRTVDALTDVIEPLGNEVHAAATVAAKTVGAEEHLHGVLVEKGFADA